MTSLVTSSASPIRRVALALDALRHGWPIRIDNGPLLLAAETGLGEDGIHAPQMLISAARAATLQLANQRDAAAPDQPVLICGEEGFDLAMARALADPAADLDWPLKGPFRAAPPPDPKAAATAMELARLAGILPAFLVDPAPAGKAQGVLSADLAPWKSPARLIIATRAHLPVAAAHDAEIVAFRSPDDLREHIALIIGVADSEVVPLVRIHSECLTGDVLGSLKCDCGPQLDAALAAMVTTSAQGGWGVLLYLRQEGRGIGLINKLRAYRLQDQGFDTLEANQRLGLPSEARDFPVAARMLGLLGVRAVRLLTNNPAKVAALNQAGIAVIERVAHTMGANPHNARYLATKRDRDGHML